MVQSSAAPLRFDPICQYRLWGGRRLGAWLDVPLPGNGPIGEVWLLSDRADNPSRVSNGPFKGRTLAELIAASPEAILGKLTPRFKRFPLLLKYLDVSQMLSVQVHPSDANANLLPVGETGKTEGWVVLEADPQSRIYVGLKTGATPAKLRTLSKSNVDEALASFSPAVGQSILVEAGDVHAFGDGLVVLEVQQNSDVTFRLYDWDHIDPATGLARPLQVEQALECVDLAQGVVGPAVQVVEATSPSRRERLLDCRHFRLWRIAGSAPFEIDPRNAPIVLVCIEGAGDLEQDAADFRLKKGEVMLLPATAGVCRFRPDGDSTLLEITVPSE
ncbi:class I mannose-6-phosphate isomerase [Acuticoccus sp. M5D2P5]|uniref:type I phosphomannose isomerase catalytic subunit n=1 Tax=Acuticoccus kalidii TaxID=2910977 RepID=UPI001F45549D|nr:type I phosphomannose isomerase catalytic subunit [Acuticoccus kalidii]MCF3934133.1 class I mannose-6-phosphate isomerase [Acuticoccus kalidii]